ncbi:MAG TPA: polysaccharide deacetylase family protein [Thermomicrobiales bacterium]|nr:polysaccharide deacetylase family protein [Thermomicrobiales bacterium]
MCPRWRLPLPFALLMAAGVVVAERLGRRGVAGALAAALLVGVLLAGCGDLLLRGAQSTPAGAATPGPAASPVAVAAMIASPVATAAPAATPVASPRAAASPALVARRPASPTVVASPTRPPSPTAVPPTPTLTLRQATPRGTTVLPILMYHYVRVVTDRSDTIGINLSVTPDLFAAQMQYLADHGYTTLTMHDVFAILAGQQPLPPRPIALTFDDGYRDFYTAAWPVLRAHHFKATSYIITGVIGQERYMTWPMLKELDASGLIEIGAHTVGHIDLHAATDARDWQEIHDSAVTLEQGLGHPVTAFCYPSGKYDQDVIALVRKAGFLTATTVEYGAKQNLQWAYTLPRVRVNGPDPLATWIAKLP